MNARRVVSTVVEFSDDDARALLAELEHVGSPAVIALRRALSESHGEPLALQPTARVVPVDPFEARTAALLTDDPASLPPRLPNGRQPTPEQIAEAEALRQRYSDAVMPATIS